MSRLKTILIILTVFSTIYFLHTSAQAQHQLPKGSYQDSCVAAQVIGSNLVAKCTRADGTRNTTKINYTKCEGDIRNNNGELNCVQKRSSHPKPKNVIPAGTYKNSCKNIKLDGNKLKAKCRKENGVWNNTKINYKQCASDIYNENGELRCKKRGGPVPRGSYKQSCQDYYVEGNQLKARCLTKKGILKNTSLNFRKCIGDISNINGELTCESKYAPNLPEGSYIYSCRDLRIDGDKLKAECQKNNGSWTRTSMNYKNCKGDIANINGRLACDTQNTAKLPKGSYKNTCKDFYMKGDILEAKCKDSKGKYKHSSIKYKYCSKGIWNDNGKLRCNK